MTTNVSDDAGSAKPRREELGNLIELAIAAANPRLDKRLERPMLERVGGRRRGESGARAGSGPISRAPCEVRAGATSTLYNRRRRYRPST